MNIAPRDPLLAAARFVLGLVTAGAALLAIALAVAIPVVFAIRGKVLAHLVSNGAPLESIWAVLFMQFLMAIAAGLGFYFFRHLYRIIDTVGSGDSFSPENARRLNAMAWISIAVHLLAIPLQIVSNKLATYSDYYDIDLGVSFGGMILALVLFILARVFREGNRMRVDLEGTV